jgi:hypothetical protein
VFFSGHVYRLPQRNIYRLFLDLFLKVAFLEIHKKTKSSLDRFSTERRGS